MNEHVCSKCGAIMTPYKSQGKVYYKCNHCNNTK